MIKNGEMDGDAVRSVVLLGKDRENNRIIKKILMSESGPHVYTWWTVLASHCS